jgi:hypothetical protein
VSGLEELSREELLALVAGQAHTIELLTARLERLEAENVELKRRLAQNSRDSSKPPSSDGPEHAPPPRSLRRKDRPHTGETAWGARILAAAGR